jgi:hypothetical protein
MKKIYVFLAVGGMAYVTANANLTGWEPDAVYENAAEAIEAVRESDYCLQLDRKLLDSNLCCGGFCFAGDDYDLWTDDLQPNE